MNCPHCNNKLMYNMVAYYNMQRYMKPVNIRADCCGHGVTLTPIMQFECRKYEGDNIEDDWGAPIKKDTQ